MQCRYIQSGAYAYLDHLKVPVRTRPLVVVANGQSAQLPNTRQLHPVIREWSLIIPGGSTRLYSPDHVCPMYVSPAHTSVSSLHPPVTPKNMAAACAPPPHT